MAKQKAKVITGRAGSFVDVPSFENRIADFLNRENVTYPSIAYSVSHDQRGIPLHCALITYTEVNNG